MSILMQGEKDLVSTNVILEEQTGVLPTMDNDHRYIHQGKMFSAYHKFTVVAGGNHSFSFKTPATKYIHYRLASIEPSADKVELMLYEDAEITAATGTVIASNNRERNSTLTAGVEIRALPTFTKDGTLLPGLSTYLPGSTGVGQSRTGTNSKADSEIVLKRNTVYKLYLENGSTSSNTIAASLRWYEEDEG